MIYLLYLLAVIMIFAGIYHFVNPNFYKHFIPRPFPKLLSNILAGIIEIVIGLALIWPSYRKLGGLAFLILMVLFLPLHTWDCFREKPAIGSRKVAYIRLAIQFVLIYFGWWIWMNY